MTRGVAITGIGVVSPIGIGHAAFWNSLVAGQSGIRPITLFDASEFPVRIGGQVVGWTENDARALAPRLAHERDRKVLLGFAAAAQAIGDARIGAGALADAHLVVGVGLETFFLEDLTRISGESDWPAALVRGRDPSRSCLQTPLDRLAHAIGEEFGIAGRRITNCSACAAGAQAIGQAFRAIRDGQAEVALAGAADSMLNPLGLGGFSLLRVLSAENDRPAEACRPFDATRQGTVLGEGAAFLLLESADHAAARGASIYARIVGYGASLDAFRVTDPEPSGRGAALSMTRALRDAQLPPGKVDAVNAHGTGTPKNDIVETAAIKQALGSRATEISVHAVKSMTGHMIAASGAVEAAAAALSLRHGLIPPTINLRHADPQCDLDCVPNVARPFPGRIVLSNSFGFGGQNATLIFATDGEP